MKNLLHDLWEKEELPIVNAILFPDGRGIYFYIDMYELTITKGEEFDLNEFISQDTDNVSPIGPLCRLATDGGMCRAGEASYGSEGFIAYLNHNNEIVWILFSENSNPFDELRESAPGKIIASSTFGYDLYIDLKNPLDMQIKKANWYREPIESEKDD